MKLQESFYSERNAVGSWTVIGYKAPGTNNTTTNSTYNGASISGAEGTSTTEVANAWYANNNVKLNDCAPAASNGNWALKVTPATITAEASASVAFDATVASDNCLQLTPNFKAIGK